MSHPDHLAPDPTVGPEALGGRPYFAERPDPELLQGNIYLAPTATAWSVESLKELGLLAPSQPVGVPPAPPALGDPVRFRPWETQATGAELAPPMALEVTWGPVMFLSHECEAQKEFNEYIEARAPDGNEADVQRARDEADARWDLDRFVLVAPLLEYTRSVAPTARFASIQRGVKIGYVPVPAGGVLPAPSFVHLSRIYTVERRMLANQEPLASLTPEAVLYLRYKLGEALSVRNIAILSQLNAAIGHTIADVKPARVRGGTSTVNVHLDNGGVIAVDVKNDPKQPRPERVRSARAGRKDRTS